MEENVPISAVVITRNEEQNIANCLESVFEVGGSHLHEVILVDSNSTDRTVAIAEEFPVTIARITDDEYVTPAAGRYVGGRLADGEYVLFVDGDVELTEGWLEEALKQFRRGPSVAGVSGYLNETPNVTEPHAVNRIKVVMLLRRTILDEEGGFDPYMKGAEDYELSFRLVQRGYELVKLPTVVAKHPEGNLIYNQLRTVSRGYPYGNGQLIRRFWSSPSVLSAYLWYMRRDLIAVTWLLVGALSAVLAPVIAVLWFVLSVIGYVFIGRQKGWTRTAMFPIQSVLRILYLLLGALKTPQDDRSFPGSVVEVSERHVLSRSAD